MGVISINTSCPVIYGPLSKMRWAVTINPEPGSSAPTCLSTFPKGTYGQYLNLNEKGAGAIDDGLWHTFTMLIQRETSVNAGDGVLTIWIDGIKIMDYVGNDPANPAFGQVYTRTLPFGRTVAFPSVINRGSPYARSHWFDNVRFWSPGGTP